MSVEILGWGVAKGNLAHVHLTFLCFVSQSLNFKNAFSNSLIIHQVKTETPNHEGSLDNRS